MALGGATLLLGVVVALAIFLLLIAPIALLVLLMFAGCVAFWAIRQIRRLSFSHVKQIVEENLLWVVGAIAVTLFAAGAVSIFALEQSITSDQTRQEMRFVIQILTGNWSPPPFLYPQKSEAVADPYALLKISISASFALVTNLASVGAFGGLLGLLITLRRKERAMRLEQVYRVRDVSIRTSIIALLDRLADANSINERTRQDIEKIIDDGFAEGNQVWTEEHLVTMFGESEAKKMRELLLTANARIKGSKLIVEKI